LTLIEEAPPTDVIIPPLSGIQKAAILLVTLGEQASAAIVQKLSDEELRKVTQSIAGMQSISPQQAEQVLEEFCQATVVRNFPSRGGADYAKRVLTSAFGREGGNRLVDEMDLNGGGTRSGIEPLRATDPQQLARLIMGEHPQTVAIILAHLPQTQAAALLASLPQDRRADITIRMANLDQISPDIIMRIATVLGHKIKSLGRVKREPIGGARAVAELLNRMDGAVCDEILEGVREREEALEEGIRHYMFVFDDLLLIDAKGVKEIVAKVDRKLLVMGLKGTSDQMKNHILSSMSSRGAEMLREDMDALGPIKIREVEAAQQQIIAVVRALEAEGVLSLKGGGDEQYVV
jgi:flagellar motor switch protein FliG